MRKTLLTVAAFACLAAAPAQADGATRWVVKGGGWGHAIGMSQYGAYGFALNGRNYRQILSHYYRGTKMGRASRDVRVLLQASVGASSFSGATSAGRKRLAPRWTYSVRRRGGRIVISNPRGKVVARTASMITISGADAIVRVGGKGRYRGVIEYRPGASGGVTTVNRVDLEDYVRGVVPNESPSSWPLEALKAQAVAARSYAIATDKSTSPVFDHYDTVASQVYRGYDSETARTNRAVATTPRQVLRYDGKVAATYFFSTSGGHTENNENVWGGAPLPYLRGVKDPYDHHSPYHRWRVRYTPKRLGRALGVGRIRSARVLKRGASPRIVRVRIGGTAGRKTFHGYSLRSILGLRDMPRVIRRITASGSSATAAAAGVGSRASARYVYGRIAPAKRGARITVQRRTAKGWRSVARGRLGKSGTYRIALARRGIHRVRFGGDAGPAVRVR